MATERPRSTAQRDAARRLGAVGRAEILLLGWGKPREPHPREAGRTDRHYAALEGRVADIEAALSAGEDPSTPDSNGYTPLHFAAQQEQLEITQALLDAGATVDAKDRFGKTPLSVALFNVRDGSGDVVRLLLQAGASPDARTASGVSPRDLADRVTNYDLKRFFI